MGMSLRCRGSKAEGYGCSPVLVASRVVRGHAVREANVVGDLVLLFRRRALHEVVVRQSRAKSDCCTTLLRLECPTRSVSDSILV